MSLARRGSCFPVAVIRPETMAESANEAPEPNPPRLSMTARWSDPDRLPVPPPGTDEDVNPSVYR